MRVVNDAFIEPSRRKIFENPHDEWFAAGGQQSFGRGVAEWAHALAAASGKNHRFHFRDLKSCNPPALPAPPTHPAASATAKDRSSVRRHRAGIASPAANP